MKWLCIDKAMRSLCICTMHLLHKESFSFSGLKEGCMGITIYVHVSFGDDKFSTLRS